MLLYFYKKCRAKKNLKWGMQNWYRHKPARNLEGYHGIYCCKDMLLREGDGQADVELEQHEPAWNPEGNIVCIAAQMRL